MPKQALYKKDNLLLTYAELEKYEDCVKTLENAEKDLQRAKFSPLFTVNTEQKIERAKLTKKLLEGKGKKRLTA